MHKELKGLDIRINEWGQIVGNTSVDELNSFLNRHVPDWKLDEKVLKENKKDAPAKTKKKK